MRQRRPIVRAYHRAHKLNRTIADLAESLQYRLKIGLV